MSQLKNKQFLYPLSGSFTGSFSGSFTGQATSASYALSASYWSGSIINATSASYANYASNAGSASYAATASYILGSVTIDTGSLVTTSSFNAYTASINLFTASINSYTASNNANITALNLATASLNSYTASLNAKTGSFATTGSNIFTADQTIQGTLTVTKIIVQTVTASQTYSSGSNVFGNSLANTQVFTGSVSMTGSLVVGGTTIINSGLGAVSINALTITGTSGNLLRLRGYGDLYLDGSSASLIIGSSNYGANNANIYSGQTTGTQFFRAIHNNGNNAIRAISNGVVELNPVAGNVLMGTTTDAGYKLDVNGTFRQTGSTTASGALAVGSTITPTLIAAANSDVLVGLDINPTFNTGSFTGVTNLGLRINGYQLFSSGGIYSTSTQTTALVSELNYFVHKRLLSSGTMGFKINTNSGAGGADVSFWRYNDATGDIEFGNSQTNYGLQFYANNAIVGKFFVTGNFALNTTTDAGYKLDVNGTARVQGAATITGAITATSNGHQLGNLQLLTSGIPGTTGQGIITSTRKISFQAQGEINTADATAYQFLGYGDSKISLTQNASGRTVGFIQIKGGFQSPNYSNTSGNIMWLNPDYNMVGNTTANTILRGIYYNPTLTDLTATTHIAIETVSGNSLLGTTSGSVGVGATSTINASSILQVTSTTQGFLPPRMTTAQRDAISSPATGLQVYNTTTNTNDFYNGSAWANIAAGAFPYTGSAQITGSLGVTGSVNATSFTGSLFGTASYASNALTASYFSGSITNATSASYATTASYALTASAASTFVVANSITASSALINGILTAQTLVVQTVTSSVMYSSGSNVFGNDISNTQVFTGSMLVTGSVNISGTGSNSATLLRVGGVTGAVPQAALAVHSDADTKFILSKVASTDIKLSLGTNGAWGDIIGNYGLTLRSTATAAGTSDGRIQIIPFGGTTTYFFSGSGNAGFNQSTDAGYKLDVNGTSRFQGTTYYPSSSVMAAIVGGATLFTIVSNDSLTISPTVLRITSTYTYLQNSFIYGNSTQNGNIFNFGNTSGGATGLVKYFNISGNCPLQSGGSYRIINIESALSNDNSTETFIGIYYNPTITGFVANTNHKAFENTTGNVLLGTTSGETVIGSSTTSGAKLTIGGSVTASSALAQGAYFNNTLVAAANSDVLVGLDINPTFTNGAYTGVSNYALRIGANISSIDRYISFTSPGTSGTGKISAGASNTLILDAGYLGVQLSFSGTSVISLSSTTVLKPISDNTVSLGATASTFRFANIYSVNTSADNFQFQGTNILSSSAVANGIGLFSNTLNLYANSSQAFKIFSTGNTLIQTGGTFTDAGYKLDVNGTARVQGAITTTSVLSLSSQTYTLGMGASVLTFSTGTTTSAISLITTGGTGTILQGGTDFQLGSYGSTYVSILPGNNRRQIVFGVNQGTSITDNNTVDTSPITSAVLRLGSTTRGFLPPVMTTTQRDAISSPATGLQVYNTTTNTNDFYNGSAWANIAAGAFPYTGSAQITGSLGITGSLTLTGTITAQTLVVQTVTSSVMYSSGSNVFGNDISNTQVFTGSVNITGSLTVSGSVNLGLSQVVTAVVTSSIIGSNNLFMTSTGSFTSAFYKYTMYSGSNSRAGEVVASFINGTSSYTDFSTVDNGTTLGVTASVSIASSQAQLNFQTSTAGWNIKSQATFI